MRIWTMGSLLLSPALQMVKRWRVIHYTRRAEAKTAYGRVQPVRAVEELVSKTRDFTMISHGQVGVISHQS